MNWNNPDYPWSNELSPAKCPNNSSFPVDYDFMFLEKYGVNLFLISDKNNTDEKSNYNL